MSALSSHPLKSLSLAHLGQPLFTVDKPGGELDIEHVIEGLGIPPEGIEFWVEGVLASAPGENQRPAIRLELIPEDLEREARTVTLWGHPGESRIEAPAVFRWLNSSN